MKTQIASSALLIAALAAAGCDRKEDKVVASETPSGTAATSTATADQRDQALIRVIHAIPDASAVDVLADEQTLETNVAYGTATQYKAVPANVDDFAVRTAGQQAGLLAENSESVMSGRHYTLIAYPGKDNERAELQVITDDHEAPEAGHARVRVINAAADLDAVDVHVPGEKDAWLDDVDFREATGYEKLETTAKTIELRAADGRRVIAKPRIQVEAGKSYTIVVVGRSKKNPTVNTLVIEDQVMTRRMTDDN